MVKIYAIEIIFKSHEPFQSYQLTGPANSAFLDKKNPSDVDGVTPLHEAERWGRLKICSLMFDHTKKLNVVDYKGRTPKNLAEENGHLEVAKLLENAYSICRQVVKILNKKLYIHHFKRKYKCAVIAFD